MIEFPVAIPHLYIFVFTLYQGSRKKKFAFLVASQSI